MITAEKYYSAIRRRKQTSLKTPYYLIDETRLVKNLEKIKFIRERSGAKSVLALKMFFDLVRFRPHARYMDGTTSSSLYEARLGHEKFGKEVHAYSVVFSDDDIKGVLPFATKIIFNSVSQLKRFYPQVKGTPIRPARQSRRQPFRFRPRRSRAQVLAPGRDGSQRD